MVGPSCSDKRKFPTRVGVRKREIMSQIPVIRIILDDPTTAAYAAALTAGATCKLAAENNSSWDIFAVD